MNFKKNSSIQQINNEVNTHKFYFEIEDSSLWIKFCFFKNLRLSNPLMLYSNSFDFDFRVENCLFDNIYPVYEGVFDLFHITNTNGNIYFLNSTFTMLSLFDNIISLKKSYGILFLNNLHFIENEVYSHILSVQEANLIMLNNTICSFTNNKNAILYQNAGGVLRLYNILKKSISHVVISHGYSVKTCFGIKIIDDIIKKWNASNLENFTVNIFS